jgi:hypothetical protein
MLAGGTERLTSLRATRPPNRTVTFCASMAAASSTASEGVEVLVTALTIP